MLLISQTIFEVCQNACLRLLIFGAVQIVFEFCAVRIRNDKNYIVERWIPSEGDIRVSF